MALRWAVEVLEHFNFGPATRVYLAVGATDLHNLSANSDLGIASRGVHSLFSNSHFPCNPVAALTKSSTLFVWDHQDDTTGQPDSFSTIVGHSAV
jgi:hypothetical protein